MSNPGRQPSRSSPVPVLLETVRGFFPLCVSAPSANPERPLRRRSATGSHPLPNLGMAACGFAIWTAVQIARLASGGEPGRVHPENDSLARPQVSVTVGRKDADLTGGDNRVLQAAVDYVGNLGGGLVLVGPGEYLMRDALHLRSRVTVRGAGRETVLKKDREVRSALAADGDFGESALMLLDPAGFDIGSGVYLASGGQRHFHGTCATILNRREHYLTLSRPLNADLMMAEGGFAATVFPVVSGNDIQDAVLTDLVVDGNRGQNATSLTAAGRRRSICFAATGASSVTVM